MKPNYFSIPYVGWMALFVVTPIVMVFVFALTTPTGEFTLRNFSDMGLFLPVFIRSFRLAFLATVVCIVLGYPVAYLLARETTRVQRILFMLIMLPLWMNFLLRTYAWMSILENTGLLNQLLSFLSLPTVRIINTETAVVIGMVYNFLPFMILPIYSVIVKIDKNLIEAAHDLGANTFSVFRKLIAPLSIPGILSGVTMVFVPAVSAFVITQLLGGGMVFLLGDLIEMQFLGTAHNPNVGSAISIVMMLIVIVFVIVMNKFGSGEEKAVGL
ncbi:MAG: ABC transporter permease [Oscillospiraceae bacterium]|nr:ABC transporter permease [Oscillospiraceae bacterium]